MTSNIRLEAEPNIGFRARGLEDDGLLRKGLIKYGFCPEFVNRIDRVILFHPLSIASVQKIAENFIKELQKLFMKQIISISVEPEVLKLLCKKGYDEQNGVRPLKRVIEEYIKKPLVQTEKLERDFVTFKAENEEIKMEIAERKTKIMEK